MTKEATRIVHSIDFSTMASNWTEHLCLHRLADGSFRLDVLGWEVWGQDSEFWDEETEECEIPDEIDGHMVIGVEDGFVVIDNLVSTGNTEAVYEFTEFDWDEFAEAFSLEDARWRSEEVRDKLQKSNLDINEGKN